MFDPAIALNVHIALLALLDSARELVEETKGLSQAIAKILGRTIVAELEKSKRTMRENKMWIDENPIAERRYRYSLYGRQGFHEFTQSELDLHLGIVLRTLEHKLDKIPQHK